jgi:hypothetical protein
MALAPRTVRNKWFKSDDGVQTKVVDQDETLQDSIDLTDELEEHQAITATFVETSGPTMGSPSVDGGVVSFTHEGTGTTVLQALCDFVAYIATLTATLTAVLAYRVANYVRGAVYPNINLNFGGDGGPIGEAGTFRITTAFVTYVLGLTGKFVRVTTAGGAAVDLELVSEVGGFPGLYNANLLTALDAADDGLCDQAEIFDSAALRDAYYASLLESTLSADIYCGSALGYGAVAGEAVTVTVVGDTVGLLGGKIIRISMPSGAAVVVGTLVWDAETNTYSGVLITDLPAVDDYAKAGPIIVFTDADMLDDYNTYYALYTTKPTKTLRIPLQFIDPSHSSTDY